jgi:hypothetical protein
MAIALKMGPRIKWKCPVDGCDGLVVTPQLVIIVSPEQLRAFERSTGAVRWAADMSDTAGSVRGGIIDGMVVVAPDFEEIQAFALADGSSGFPGIVDREALPEISTPAYERPIPPGLKFDDRTATLSRNGVVFWSGKVGRFPRYIPLIAAIGETVVLNDFDRGLQVFDVEGRTLLDLPLGRRNYPEAGLVVDDDEVITMTADGTLYDLVLDP